MDFVNFLEKALNKKANIDYLPMQPGDVPETYADVTDLVEQFEYKPDTPLELGINNFVAWYCDFYKVDRN